MTKFKATLLALLSTACLAFGLAGEAHATKATPAFSARFFTGCDHYNSDNGRADVCVYAKVTRQADGLGYTIQNAEIYTVSTAGIYTACADFVGDPRVATTAFSWDGQTDNGFYPKRSETGPDLGTNNACDHTYGGDVLINREGWRIAYNYTARVLGLGYKTGTLVVGQHTAAGPVYCTAAADECYVTG